MSNIVVPFVVASERSKRVVGQALLNEETYEVVITNIFVKDLTDEEKAVLDE